MTSKKEREKQAAHALDDFVDAVLRGDTITEADLDKLVDLEVPEGQRIEYKSEGWADRSKDKTRKTGMGKPKALPARVAKYLAGFANGIGGVLVIGVAEGKDGSQDDGKPDRLDSIPETRRDEVTQGVVQGLLKLKGQLPRIEPAQFVQAAADGFYVVVGVQRASRLVQVAEPNHLLFYMRVHDTTTHAPDYLAADLFLGRRQQPRVAVEAGWFGVQWAMPRANKLYIKMTLHNIGLSWLDRPAAGLIMPTFGKLPPLPEHLKEHVRLVTPMPLTSPSNNLMQVNMARPRGEQLPPMERAGLWNEQPLDVPDLNHQTFLLAGALYVVCFNQEPAWWQVILLWEAEKRITTVPQRRLLVMPCEDEKPIVAFHHYPMGTWHPPHDWCSFGADLEGFTLLDQDQDQDQDQG